MSVEFKDFSVEVKNKLEKEALGWLHEWGGELVNSAVDNTPHSSWHREVASGWKYVVDEDKLEATIGNPYEASLWVEYGTGDQSESPKGGRKGYWVYVKGGEGSNGLSDDYQYSPNVYTLEEAKEIMAMLQSKGLDAHITKGQSAKRPLQKSFTKLKDKIKKDARERFKDIK